MRRKKLVVLGIVLIVVEAALILNMFYPALSASSDRSRKKNVPGHGSVKSINVGVYSDQACTNSIESIQWGLLEPGEAANRTVFVRNEGNANSTLAMTLSNWIPGSASGYMEFAWDYVGQVLNVSEAIEVKFTLSMLESIQGITNFSFDVTIATN